MGTFQLYAQEKAPLKPIKLKITWTLDICGEDLSGKIIANGNYELTGTCGSNRPALLSELKEGEPFCYNLKYNGGMAKGKVRKGADDYIFEYRAQTPSQWVPSGGIIQSLTDGSVMLRITEAPSVFCADANSEEVFGCGGGPDMGINERFSYGELKNLLNKSIERKYELSPAGVPECCTKETIEIWAEEEASIKIINPQPSTKHVFHSGKLVIEAEAKVEPAKYEKEVVWEIQDIQGSTKTIEPEKGSKVKITFDKLPADNREFGEKTLTAKVQGKQDQVKIRVFFCKDENDNPEGKYPNWFYYWRQGVVAGLERFIYEQGGSYYDPATQKLVISDDAASSLPGGSVPLKKEVIKRDGTRCTLEASIVITATEGVDSAARVVAHELEHYKRFEDMINRLPDYDGDRVADKVENESPYCLDSQNSNTHDLKVTKGTAGDDEVLAMAAEAEESKSKSRVRHDLDWSSPCSQSKKSR